MVGSRRARRAARLGLAVAAGLVAIVSASPVVAATGWTGPTLVGPAAFCEDVASTFDGAGVAHVVASCDGHVRYSTNATGHWVTTTFSHPTGDFDLMPQVAVDGSRVEVAFSRVIPEACGVEHVGVYVTSRALTGTAWTAPTRFGSAGDALQSFRAVAGRLHMTVTSDATSHVYYETNAGGSLKRYLLSDAVGVASLRIGSDGRARIAYEAANTLRYAIFTGTGFSKQTIPGTTAADRTPLLVLDGNNAAHVVWTHVEAGGCGGGADPGSTEYATNAGGSWTAVGARTVTKIVGLASVTLDPTTGRVDVAVGADTGLYFFTRASSGAAWSSQKLTSAGIASLSLRLDPVHGTVLAAYVRQSGEAISASVFAFTKP
jgi:hypothetical protein